MGLTSFVLGFNINIEDVGKQTEERKGNNPIMTFFYKKSLVHLPIGTSQINQFADNHDVIYGFPI